MNKKVKFGIFSKVFLYTVLILLFVIGSMFLFFANQIQSTITLTQRQQLSETFALFREQIIGKTTEEIIAFAEVFHRLNASFDLCLINEEGEILFKTDNFVNHIDEFSLEIQNTQQTIFTLSLENGVRLYADASLSESTIYNEILERAVWVFGLIIFVSLIAAFVFARRIAKPIQKVSFDTQIMAKLLPNLTI